MKHEVQVCPHCGLAMVRLAGDVNGDGLHEVLDALIEGEGWDLEQSDLWDLRAVSDLFITPDGVSELAARVPSASRARGAGRTALLTRTLTQRAYGNLFFDAINPSSRVYRSFHSERQAVRWLCTRSGREAAAGLCGSDCLRADVGTSNLTGGQRT